MLHVDKLIYSPVADIVDIRFISVLNVEKRSKHETRPHLISFVPSEVTVLHRDKVSSSLTVDLHSTCAIDNCTGIKYLD